MAGFGMLRHNHPHGRTQAPPGPVSLNGTADPPACGEAHTNRCAGVTLSTRLKDEPGSHRFPAFRST
jgi:hypothetical protein